MFLCVVLQLQLPAHVPTHSIRLCQLVWRGCWPMHGWVVGPLACPGPPLGPLSLGGRLLLFAELPGHHLRICCCCCCFAVVF